MAEEGDTVLRRPDFSVIDDTNKRTIINPIVQAGQASSVTSGSVIPEWVQTQSRTDENYFFAVGHAVSTTENMAVEIAHQRAIRALSLYQRARVSTDATDSAEVVDSNGEESYTTSYVRNASTVGQSIIRKVQITRVHSNVADGKYIHYVEIRVHLDDLFPERPLLRAVTEDDTKTVRMLIKQFEADQNTLLLDMAWDSLYEMSDDKRTTVRYLSYLYKNERYEDVVLVASASGLDGTNLLVRRAAERLHE